jgi:signal recognition particle subunit SRP54
MFDSLTQSLQQVFKNLRGHGKMSETNIKDAMREVRLALLEADVHFEVVRSFTQRVREQCLGEEVLNSVTPGQQVIKRIHEEMVHLLGDAPRGFTFSGQPSGVLLLGLHGAGKTTTAGKLARRWKGEGRKVLLAACDIRRPAAVQQLQVLGEQVGVEVVAPQPGESVPAVGQRAWQQAVASGVDVVIFDSGGRFQVDEELVEELKALKTGVQPEHVVLVVDAAIGQESVHVAESFHEAVGLTGLVLTKLDGDARGGAALSIQHVTGCPILLVGVGERAEDLEPFYPDRMASRILGMGDVVSLVEKAQASVDQDEMVRMEERLRKNSFNLEDMLSQLQQMEKLGPMEQILEMLPGAGQIPEQAKQAMGADSQREWKRAKAIIQSMTPEERRRPDLVRGRRRERIARGSGVEPRQVNELLKRFDQMKKMSKQMKKMQKRLRGAGKFYTH